MTRVDKRGVAFDALAVVVFVAIGRLQHDGADAFAPLDALNTLWPFLGGLLVAVLVIGSAAAEYAKVPTGVAVAAITAACGLALRYASGQGIALSFAIVTVVVLGVLMCGWRCLAKVSARG
ncbi:MAG: DUF3054 domain-containing protein [Actinomycetia bacterium]|nr:DUF3054 domain-containing protein [Actinomycetes bacterium]